MYYLTKIITYALSEKLVVNFVFVKIKFQSLYSLKFQ